MEQLNEFDMKQLEISGRIIDEAYDSIQEDAKPVEEKKPEERKTFYVQTPSDDKMLAEVVKRMLAKSLLNEMDFNFANPYSPGMTASAPAQQEYHPSDAEIKMTKMQRIIDLINQNIYKLRDLERDAASPEHIDIDPEGKMKALINSSISELVNLVFMTWNGATPPQKPAEEKKEEAEEKKEEKKEEAEEEKKEEENKEKIVGESVTSPNGDVFEILEFKEDDVVVLNKTTGKKFLVEKRIINKWSKK